MGLCFTLSTALFASKDCVYVPKPRAMVPAPSLTPSSDAEVQHSRKYPVLLSLLAFEFHVVLSSTGRPGAETSAKLGEFFPQAIAELTGRESHHDEGHCVGGISRQPLWGMILSRQTRPHLRGCLQ